MPANDTFTQSCHPLFCLLSSFLSFLVPAKYAKVIIHLSVNWIELIELKVFETVQEIESCLFLCGM